eukprot:gnl/MRDRNA2_/MRDRNA2_18529_c0_seq1.p1 gnl/MRDRNA2_/MRDRNA2_18529_c0~~gnl/MRDRNA2_/MRDRNA2_18529_c0_seq1.p1  ORF type:complete len:235 (+),score=48.98 gnl/MRDRNA2_/MRDRNA2_18529_c0_seq1:101-805(+)
METALQQAATVRWPALESSPEAFTEFLKALGVEDVEVHDVYGLDPELLAASNIPSPVYALILLYPDDEKRKGHCDKGKLNADAPFFMWQEEGLGNACGTIALIHAVLNVPQETILVPEESPLGKYYLQAKVETPKKRGQLLEESEEIRLVQLRIAESTETPMITGEAEYHYICFVQHRGAIYALDGEDSEPTSYGEINTGFIEDVAKLINERYVATRPGSIHFSAMALAPKADG